MLAFSLLALPAQATTTSATSTDPSRLEVYFSAEAAKIQQQPGLASPPQQEVDPFVDGSISKAEDILSRLGNGEAEPASAPKFRSTSLYAVIQDHAGGIVSSEEIAFCRELDLYVDPTSPERPKAQCDGATYEYVVEKQSISFLRDGQPLAAFELAEGNYLINGSLVRIPLER